MAAYNKFNQFVEDVAQQVHDFTPSTGDSLIIALSDTLPVATNAVLADITEISYTNLSSRALTINASSGQTSGTYKLLIDDLVLTASGTVAQFQYIIVYNDTPTSPADPLIAWYDYGSPVNLVNTETFTIDFDGTNGFYTIA